MIQAGSARWRRVMAGGSALAMGLALAGCVEGLPEAQVGRGDIRNAIAKGELTSPKAATVALVSLEGAPAVVESQFRQALTSAAATREISITDPVSAHYLVRGYLSAYPGDQGVTVAYTYDVFDAGAKQRRQRVADTLDVPGDAGDPWSAVNATVVSSLVGRSADELAVALAGTPEAQSTAGKVAGAAVAPSPVN